MMGRGEENLGRDGPKSCGIVLPPWLGYPSSSCFPAELDSVSPSNDKYTKTALRANKYTAARFPVMDGVAKHRPAGGPQPCN